MTKLLLPKAVVRSLTEAEQRYSQTEREALAVVLDVNIFDYF